MVSRHLVREKRGGGRREESIRHDWFFSKRDIEEMRRCKKTKKPSIRSPCNFSGERNMLRRRYFLFFTCSGKVGPHPASSVVGLSKAQARGERERECKVAIMSGFCGGGGGGGKGDEILRDAGGPRGRGKRFTKFALTYQTFEIKEARQLEHCTVSKIEVKRMGESLPPICVQSVARHAIEIAPPMQ